MTARRPNKHQRLSETKTVATFTPSDYNSAPLTVKMVGGALILPQRLWRRQTHPRKPRRSDQGRPSQKIGRATLNTPGTPPATPGPGPAHDGPRSPQAGAPAAGYASPAATGTARRGPQETPYTETEGTQTPHTSTGRAQGERKIKPGEFIPGKRKCSTEPPRRRHAKRAGGRQKGSKTPQQGRTPPGRKENPQEALPPAGLNYFSRALSTAPQNMRA